MPVAKKKRKNNPTDKKISKKKATKKKSTKKKSTQRMAERKKTQKKSSKKKEGHKETGKTNRKRLSKGDKVSWSSPGGEAIGRVKKKITRPRQIKGHRAEASPDAPEYLVTSEASGQEAAHNPETLKKVK